MNELQPTILDDYQHRVQEIMEHHHDEAGFPQLEDFKITRDELETYLFNRQAILDSEGNQRKQLTVYGIIAFIPILVCEAIGEANLPWGRWSLIVSIAMGVLLALIIRCIVKIVNQFRMRKLNRDCPQEAAYAEAVCDFQDKRTNQ
jgi:hypothetical protein